MADLLRGSLGFLPVGDLLTLLSHQGATGTLHFSGSDGDAALHLVEGKLIRKEKETAQAALLRESGSFVFSDEKLAEAGETTSLQPLIEQAAKRREEYRRARAGLPDDSAILRVVDNPETQDRITLSREQWKVLSQANGRRTVGELLRDGDALATMHALKDLLSEKLIEVATQEAPRPAAQTPTKPLTVPPEVPTADAHASRKSSSEKTVMGMKLPPVAGPKASPESTIGCLTMDSPDEQMFPLVEDNYQIGREPGNAIQLPDASVSSVHARILRTPQGFVLEDLNSRNGTFVNGDRIEKRLLKENDRIRFGKVQLIFNIAGDKPAVSPSTVFQQRPS